MKSPKQKNVKKEKLIIIVASVVVLLLFSMILVLLLLRNTEDTTKGLQDKHLASQHTNPTSEESSEYSSYSYENESSEENSSSTEAEPYVVDFVSCFMDGKEFFSKQQFSTSDNQVFHVVLLEDKGLRTNKVATGQGQMVVIPIPQTNVTAAQVTGTISSYDFQTQTIETKEIIVQTEDSPQTRNVKVNTQIILSNGPEDLTIYAFENEFGTISLAFSRAIWSSGLAIGGDVPFAEMQMQVGDMVY